MRLFEYLDYRKYLSDYYQHQKQRNPAYSYRVFANRAKLTSPNYLKLVMDGERPLTGKNLSKFARGLGLNPEETDYFRALVAYQECRDAAEKETLLKDLSRIRIRHSKEASEISRDRTEILKRWHHWIIREMVLLSDFRPDPEWIAARLRHRITSAEAKESLDLLLRLEFIKQENGNWSLSEPLITTRDEVSSSMLRGLHRQFMELGIQSILNDAIDRREFSGLTIAIPKSKVPKIKQSIKNFRKELNKIFSDEKNNEEVYHLMIGFFPITQKGVQG